MMVAGSSDVIAVTFGVSVNAVIWTLRTALLVLPPIAGARRGAPVRRAATSRRRRAPGRGAAVADTVAIPSSAGTEPTPSRHPSRTWPVSSRGAP